MGQKRKSLAADLGSRDSEQEYLVSSEESYSSDDEEIQTVRVRSRALSKLLGIEHTTFTDDEEGGEEMFCNLEEIANKNWNVSNLIEARRSMFLNQNIQPETVHVEEQQEDECCESKNLTEQDKERKKAWRITKAHQSLN